MVPVGAQAREVVEFYGNDIGAHPVGTGAFRLAEWKRSSKIVLERNPNFREAYYEAEPPADDPVSQQLYAENKGKRLPIVDRVEVSIIEESQPRWLAFLNNELDWINLPYEFLNMAIPGGKLSPTLARDGVRWIPDIEVVTVYMYFNMKDATLGGYTPEKVALRRAISLAYNTPAELQIARKNQAIPAQTAIAPAVYGYDPTVKTEMSDYDPDRARALLDTYGYVDRDGDGWRDLPDGSPLLIEYSTQPDQLSRQLVELWDKSMRAVNIRMVFRTAKWPENLKASRAGKLMMWGVAWSATTPDADTFLALAYGPNKGGANHSRFDLPAFNALFEKQGRMPDGPEREAVLREASKLMVAYLPYKISAHRIATDLMHPWVLGYRRNPFIREFWKFLDIDTALEQARTAP